MHKRWAAGLVLIESANTLRASPEACRRQETHGNLAIAGCAALIPHAVCTRAHGLEIPGRRAEAISDSGKALRLNPDIEPSKDGFKRARAALHIKSRKARPAAAAPTALRRIM
jgi:hypothetical protein